MAADEPAETDVLPRLTVRDRVSAGLVGVTLGVAGTFAVFNTDNELGSAGLLVGGATFGLLATTGYPLRRVGLGDAEAEFDLRVGRKLRTAATSSQDEGTRLRALDWIEDSIQREEPLPPAVRAAAAARDFERQVIDALQTDAVDNFARPQAAFDALVDGHVAVLAKYRQAGRRPGAGALTGSGSYADSVRRAAASPSVDTVVVVTNSITPTTDRDHIENQVVDGSTTTRSFVVFWDGQSPEALLRRVRALSQPPN